MGSQWYNNCLTKLIGDHHSASFSYKLPAHPLPLRFEEFEELLSSRSGPLIMCYESIIGPGMCGDAVTFKFVPFLIFDVRDAGELVRTTNPSTVSPFHWHFPVSAHKYLLNP